MSRTQEVGWDTIGTEAFIGRIAQSDRATQGPDPSSAHILHPYTILLTAFPGQRPLLLSSMKPVVSPGTLALLSSNLRYLGMEPETEDADMTMPQEK